MDIQLMLGDCLEKMKDIQSKSIDMVLCDLPYGVLNRNSKGAQWDNIIPLTSLWKEYERVIKDNGAIVLFAQGMFTANLMMSNPKLWRYNLVWNKVLISGFLNSKRMPLRQHEDICVFYRNLPVYNPQMRTGKPLHSKGTAYKCKDLTNNCYGDFGIVEDCRKGSTEKYPSSILSFQKVHPSTAVHPTEKPVELCKYLIKTYTNCGDIVLDNTMGSGSTLVACVETNRRGIGIEQNEEYYNIACKRVKQAMNE